jgi:hypothetical protein
MTPKTTALVECMPQGRVRALAAIVVRELLAELAKPILLHRRAG